MNIYQLITYDVWGNAKDGWEINNWFKHDIFTIADDMQLNDIIKLIDFKNPKQIRIEECSEMFYFYHKKTDEPICHLELIKE